MRMKYNKLEIESADHLVFGTAPYPVTTSRGLVIGGGKATVHKLQDLFASSDTYYDPQALILAPGNVIEISREIVKGSNYIDATVKGCLKGMEVIENALEAEQLKRDEREEVWIVN